MSLFLSKLLPVFVYPLGLAILLAAVALALSFVGSRRLTRTALAASLIVLYVASMPAFANWIYTTLESQFPPAEVASLPQADVAIVLGGAVGAPLPPRVATDLSEAGDRVLHAARLFRAGKVEAVVASGGNLPWLTPAKPEAELIAELLVELGVPRAAIVVETESRNTYENAANTAAILSANGWRTALLVTSGAHMPRALAVFRRSGIDAMPAATDVRVHYPLYSSLLDFLPDAAALERTTDALKEWIGLIVYRARGWA